MKHNISMHWTVTWTMGLRYNTWAFHLRPLILNNLTVDWGFGWFHNHQHLDIVRVKGILQFQWLLLPRSTAPTWSFDMIEESIQNLISNYVENQDTEYLHYLDLCPIAPSMQREKWMKHVVAEIGELDNSIGSIQGHWGHALSPQRPPALQMD